MKKAFALSFLLFFLVACGQQPEPEIPEPSSAVVVELQPEPEPEPEPEPVIETETAERLAEEQKEIIIETIEHPPKLEVRDRTTIAEQMWEIYQGLDSYQFKTETGDWFARGEKVRLLPFDAFRRTDVKGTDGESYHEVFIDEIIFDREEKTATGYCTGDDDTTRRQCAAKGIFDIALVLDYTEFMIILPDDWVKAYLDVQPVDEDYAKYFIESRETFRVEYPDGVEMFFFPRAGLPLKVVKSAMESYRFDKVVINQVRPEDVIHRAREDIPAKEYFYNQNY